MIKLKFLRLFYFVSIFSIEYANASILRVPDDYLLIQEAIDSAVEGDTVLVANGLYQGNGNRDIDFLGKNLLIMSESGPDSTTIDCSGTASDPHRAFYFHTKEDSTSVINGFTIQNGYGPVDSSYSYGSQGGAILCSDSVYPKIINCRFLNNHAVAYGGAITSIESWPSIENSTFQSNSCEYAGGALYVEYWPTEYLNQNRIDINQCYFDSNSSLYGGAIRWVRVVVDVRNCEFGSNNAWAGGAILGEGTGTLENCSFNKNHASSGGGAVANVSNIKKCTFIDNSAISSGGAVSRGKIDSSLFVNNIADNGGAVYGALVTNSTFHDNQGYKGGAVYGGSVTNSIFHDNQGCIGGAIYGGTDLNSCELFKNSADTGGAISGTRFVSGCKIYNNLAYFGGAVHNIDSLKYCVVWGNQAEYGGAIGLTNKVSVITRYNTIVANSAAYGSAISCVRSFPLFQYSTIAFNKSGKVTHTADDYSLIRIRCSDVYGNIGGDFVVPIEGLEDQDNNFSLDPLFCPTSTGECAISSASPCAPLNNSCLQDIGGLSIVEPCSTCCSGIRGDANNDGSLFPNILDLVFLVDLIFRNGPLPVCNEEADINGDGQAAGLLDLTFIVDHIFRGGPNADPCLFALEN